MNTPGLRRTSVGEGEVALVPVRVGLVTGVQLAGRLEENLRQVQVQGGAHRREQLGGHLVVSAFQL